MRKTAALLLAFFIVGSVFAKPINSDDAMRVAYSFLITQNDGPIGGKVFTLSPYSAIKGQNSSTAALHIFNINNEGFIIISGDDAAYPILGYSYSNSFGEGEVPVQMESMLISFTKEIEYLRVQNIQPDAYTSKLWADLLTGQYTNPKLSSAGPLLTNTWDQGGPYNALCPEDPEGPGGRVYAGCVASMMAMTMYYYRYPTQGTGSHGYTSDYGYLHVDFSQSNYDYEQMPGRLIYENYDVAKLMYDCGVS